MRLRVLCFVLCTLAALTVVCLPSDPLIAARWEMPKEQPPKMPTFDPDAASSKDIPDGSVMPSKGAGKAIREFVSKKKLDKGFIVVGLGNCTSCIHFNLNDWSAKCKRLHILLVGFSGSYPDKIQKFRKEQKVDIPVFFDKDNAFGEAVNAYWNGRPYYFDKNFKLIWRLRGFTTDDSFDKQRDLLQEIKNNERS